jgi:hypothetical protein
MVNRVLKVVLLSIGLTGMAYLLLSMRDGSSREPAMSVMLSPGKAAYAQSPGTQVRYADFGLSIPRVASVLSVEDNIRPETDLVLRRSS